MELSKKQKLWVFWGFILIYNGIQFLIPVIYGVVYGFKYGLEKGGILTSDDMALMQEEIVEKILELAPMIFSVSALIILIIYYIVLKKYLKDSLYTFIKNKTFIISSVIGFVVMVVLSYLWSLIYSLLGIEGDSANQQEIVRLLISSPIIMTLTTVVLAPIIEELFFRKVLLDFFSKWGNIIGIGVSSLFFGLVHVIAGDFIFLPIYMTMGIVLGYLYIKSDKNIFVPITAHILNNLLSIVLALIGV